MANLLSFAKRVVNTVNNDVVKPIQRDVVAPVAQSAHTVYSGAAAPIRLAAGEISHNNQAIQNARQSAPTPLRFGAALGNLGTFAAGGPLARGAELGIHGAVGFAAPKVTPIVVRNVAAGLGEHAAPQLLRNAVRFGTPTLTGAGLNAINAPTGAVAQGVPIKQAVKTIPQAALVGAGLGLAAPVAGAGLKIAGRGAVNLADNRTPLNAVGAVGKNVNKLTPLEQQLGHKIETKAYTGPNLNPGAFTAADRKLVGDSMTREARQITPEDRQFAKTTNVSPERARNIRMRPSTPNQREVMVNKALAGKQPQELPLTPPHEGDLTPMQNIPTVNKLFSNKVNAIRKIGTPNAQALADTVQRTDTTAEALRSHYMSQIPTVQKLSKNETAQMFDVVEKKVAQRDSAPKVVQAAKEWQKLTPQIAQNAFKQGALIGERKNYVPHNYSPDFWTKRSGSQYDSAVQHLMDTNKVDHQSAVKLFDNLAQKSSTKASWFANFENARLTDLPGYAKDKSTLYKYVEGAANRTSQSQHLGLNNEIANKYLQNIRMEGGDMLTAKKAVENYLHSADKGTGAKTLRGIRGGFGTARLGTAAISHMGQTSNVGVDTGIVRTVKSWGKFLANNPAHKDFVAKTGVTNPQVLHAYQDQFTSVRGLMSKATAPGLNQVMKVNRSVTALAYRDYGNALAKAGNESELRKLGVTGDIGKTLTPEQAIQAARGGVNRTMFSPSRATTPTFAETPAGKAVGQYRTAYAYKQTGFIYDRILKEAKAGNIKPLLRYLTVSAGVGGATIQAKKMISGSKEGPGGKALDVAAALGGIPGEVAAELARYGVRGGIKGLGAVAGTVAPMAGEAVNAYDAASQALHGKFKPIERYGLGLIPAPGVNSRLSKALVPPKNVPQKGSATAGPSNDPVQTKANAAAELKQFKAKPPQTGLNRLSDGRYVYSIDGQVHTADNINAAGDALRKAAFSKESGSYKYVPNVKNGGVVLRKSPEGSVSSISKTQFDYKLGAATLVMQKNSGDVNGYLSTAKSQIASIAKQLQDPNIDPLDSMTLQNQAETLQKSIDKYSSYGGFTKPKSGGSRVASSRKTTAKSFTIPKISAKKLTAPKGVKVKKVAMGSLKTRKISVSKMPKIA